MLRLSCCAIGRLLVVRWIQPDGRDPSQKTTMDTSPAYDQDPRTFKFDWKKADVAWVVRSVMGHAMGREFILCVSFCPGCGTRVPKLMRKSRPNFHKSNFDEYGHCRTCRHRYCDGQDPSRVYEATAEP
mgnify:CR=1 FL=1